MRPLVLLAVAVVAVAACHKRDERKWTCAMHPQIVRDQPGDCPICGMKLIPLERDAPGPSSAPPQMQIDAERRRLIGLKTVEVSEGMLGASLRTTGRISLDETRVVKVTPRFEGFIEQLFANYTGKPVKKGEPLASIYSPEVLSSQEELLLALKPQPTLAKTGLPDVADAARARLRLFGVSEAELVTIEKTGKPIRAIYLRAPISGVLTSKNVVAGAKVGPAEALFDIVDLSRLWVLADVYEYELPRVRVGQRATITLSYWPGQKWVGRVGFIYPAVEEKTRTIKVRVEVDNPKGELKAEMFADVVLEAPPQKVLRVPEDAVIDTGTRKLAFVSLGDGRLEAREIATGLHADGFWEVRAGLRAGEKVAVGASFLIDSESKLRAAISSMGAAIDGGTAPAPAHPPGHQPGGAP
jgi:Cu(I)/Ag(I) efflux system membrane fusion protein